MVDSYVRGNLIEFSVSFTDPDGDTINPPGANLYIHYTSLTKPIFLKIAMVTADSGTTWTATLDSTSADAGSIYWHARCTGPIPSAIEDTITLVANPANPAPSPTS